MDVKDIIYLSQADFTTLANGGTITKGGQTYSYDDGNVYAVEYTEPSVPTKVSDLTNDSGFLTLGTLPIYQGGVE